MAPIARQRSEPPGQQQPAQQQQPAAGSRVMHSVSREVKKDNTIIVVATSNPNKKGIDIS
jgi:hypothetical protein